MLQLFGILYIVSAALLGLYGLNMIAHVAAYWWQHLFIRPPVPPQATSPALDDARLPLVLVQLPMYNERHVAARLIDAVAALDWPADRLHVQVLDDSTDDTTAIVAAALARHTGRGWHAEHVRRAGRTGYKAGALQHGLAADHAAGYIAIFDADFVPQPGFLRAIMPGFADPGVACVQARWGHINGDVSLFTQVQALGFDAHYRIEKQARHACGAFIHFNGSAGVWRRAAIDAAGGWQADTLTEDLDLSYRGQLAGWRIVYRDDVVAPAELPVQMEAFRRQQHRWAKGSMQTTRKLLGPLWRADQPWWRKVTGTLHLTNYLAHPLMPLNLLLLLPALRLGVLPWVASLGLGLAAVAAPLMYLTALHVQRVPWPGRPLRLAAIIMLGAGLSLTTTRAALEGLTGAGGHVFLRTPKFAADGRGAQGAGTWHTSAYALPRDPLVWVELVMALYALALTVYFVVTGAWSMATWPLIYVAGYGYVAGLSLLQARRVQRARAAVDLQPVQP
jgi:cellulose synthase/poly-beta-1,6-N-acetylglucosamine synthase-like glycosyltransferase